jgi:hypothetical protein
VHESRRRAAELLRESGLLEVIVPEVGLDAAVWQVTLRMLEAVCEPTTSVALAILLRPIYLESGEGDIVEQIGRRWKLSNEEIDGLLFCLACEATIRSALTLPWPTLQRQLIEPRIDELMRYCEAVALVVDGRRDAIDYCSAKLAMPPDQLNPPPLLDGDKLRAAGVSPGPIYKRLLNEVRDAQLDGAIHTPDEALELAQSIIKAANA